MNVKLIISKGTPMLSQLSSRTVLVGIGATLIGIYYQLEDAGIIAMYLDAVWMARLTSIAGLAVWYFRVNLKADLGNKETRQAEIERLQQAAKLEVLQSLVKPSNAEQIAALKAQIAELEKAQP